MEKIENLSTEEIKCAFFKANNLNAALKNVLKKEAQKGSDLEKVIKILKKGVLAKKDNLLRNTLDKCLPKYKAECTLILRYAYDDEISEIANEIIEKHGENFNSTYESDGDKITITDNTEFNHIIGDVLKITESKFKELNLENNNLFKFILFDTVFDKPVFLHAQSILF